MPNLNIKPGVRALDVSMSARAVFSLLIERYLKGPNTDEHTDLKLDILAANAGLSRKELDDAIFELEGAKLLKMDTAGFDEMAMLRITKLALSADAVEAPVEDETENFDQAILFAYGKANRLRCGNEEDDFDGARHVAEVRPSGENFSLTIIKHITGSDPQTVLYVNDFLTPTECWGRWDSYVEAGKPEAVGV